MEKDFKAIGSQMVANISEEKPLRCCIFTRFHTDKYVK